MLLYKAHTLNQLIMKKLFFATLCIVLTGNSFSQKDNHSMFAIKFAPMQMLMGEVNFSYEQRVSKQSSIEVSLGPTISEIGIIGLALESRLSTENGVIKNSNLGFLAALGYRYYPISGMATAPRGLYLGPEIKYRVYNTTYSDNVSEGFGLPQLSDTKAAASQFSFKFFTGYQFWFGSKFSMDVFTAVGFGVTDISRQRVITNSDPVTFLPHPEWNKYGTSKVTFMGAFGLKFGIGGDRKDK